MNDVIEIEGEFSEIISNPAELPCYNSDSERLRKEHTRWKNEVKKSRDKKLKIKKT